jgi:DNA repair protein RadC
VLSDGSPAATPSVAAAQVAPCSRDRRLYFRDGDGFREAAGAEVLEYARDFIAQRFHPGAPVLSDLQLMEQFLRLELGPRDREVFAVLFLNRRKRLVGFMELFWGTVDSVMVHPREVIREALSCNATAVIFARNDVAGCPEPTLADKGNFIRLQHVFSLFEIRVVDYLVIGETTTSLSGARLAANRPRSRSQRPSRAAAQQAQRPQVSA